GGIVLADADALVRETIRIGLAVLERRRKHLLAGLDRELIGRKLLLLLPLLVQALVHRIGPVHEVLALHLGKLLDEVILERLLVGRGIWLVLGECRRQQREREYRSEREGFHDHAIFAVVESEAPLLSLQLIFKS